MIPSKTNRRDGCRDAMLASLKNKMNEYFETQALRLYNNTNMKIALFGKTIAPENGEYMRQLFVKLSENQVGMTVYRPFADIVAAFVPEGVQFSVFNSHTDLNADLMFSIGGDGTILDTVPFILDSGMPLVGINMGRLGFLSSLSKNEIGQAVDSVLSGDYTVEQRTLLELVSPQNVFGDVRYALNELNVIRNPEHSLLAIKVFVDDVYLNTYWGDGILLATPTGSTAYSLSAGGPIIAPNAKNFVITPIATHNLTVRPVVIPDDSVIRIQVEGREKKFVFILLLFDIFSAFDVFHRHRVCVTNPVYLICSMHN